MEQQTLNLNKICRVCLSEHDMMFSVYSELFEENSDEGQLPKIHEILANISSIRVSEKDELPTQICTKCIGKAHNFYKFQKQCDKSQLILRAYVDQIKGLNIANEDLVSNVEENEKVDLLFENPHNDLLPISDEILPSQYMTDVDENDCDSLKNCLPLGEDTVDELIKNNLHVENLEMIAPKMRSFDIDLKGNNNEKNGNKHGIKTKKDIPSMEYYKKITEDGSCEFECNICQKKFRFPQSFRIHLKNHDREHPYMCTECKKTFKVYGSLVNHSRSHSGEQPYECKLCGKKYKQSGTLSAHMRIHTGSKPFLCKTCGKGFRQAPDLTYHMRTHTKEKPYMCSICGKTMSMQCHLVQHMRTHTGEKPFKCSECNKAFPSSTRLKRHSITHTSLKPFKCNICEKSFNRNSTLQVHKKVHSGIKSHICPICNKAFLWAHILKAHVLTHKKNSEKASQNK